MRYPWLGIPFAAPQHERAADHGPRPGRAADRSPRAMVAALAVVLAGWVGLITFAIAETDSSHGLRGVARGGTVADDADPRPGRAGPGFDAVR
jgi:hypothetical protein